MFICAWKQEVSKSKLDLLGLNMSGLWSKVWWILFLVSGTKLTLQVAVLLY